MVLTGSIQIFRSLNFQAETVRKIKGFHMPIISEQEFNRHSISIQDFEKCIGFLREMDNHSPDSLVFESLLICALIYYCRPFSFNERSKNAQATPKITIDSFSEITTDEKCLHSRCMTIRNKALAHSRMVQIPDEAQAGNKRDCEPGVQYFVRAY